jgi:hypothetical protein
LCSYDKTPRRASNRREDSLEPAVGARERSRWHMGIHVAPGWGAECASPRAPHHPGIVRARWHAQAPARVSGVASAWSVVHGSGRSPTADSRWVSRVAAARAGRGATASNAAGAPCADALGSARATRVLRLLAESQVPASVAGRPERGPDWVTRRVSRSGELARRHRRQPPGFPACCAMQRFHSQGGLCLRGCARLRFSFAASGDRAREASARPANLMRLAAAIARIGDRCFGRPAGLGGAAAWFRSSNLLRPIVSPPNSCIWGFVC